MNRTAAGGALTAFAVALVGVATPSAAQAAEVAAFEISVVSANGSGCPNATATAQSVDDNSFTVDSTPFFAWSGSGSPVDAIRQNCQIALQITRPAGWTYAVQGAGYNGYAQLEEGVTGLQSTSYYFQAESTTVRGSHPVTGSGAWTATDTFAGDDLVFAPCDAERLLNINTSVQVLPVPTGVNWVYQSPAFTVDLAWQPCS
jgi:hypothetical protein